MNTKNVNNLVKLQEKLNINWIFRKYSTKISDPVDEPELISLSCRDAIYGGELILDDNSSLAQLGSHEYRCDHLR